MSEMDMKRTWGILIGVALVALLTAVVAKISQRQEPYVQASLVGLSGEDPAEDLAGFLRAQGPVDLTFPADHGPHPDFQTEWWYYTGNLVDTGGQRLGYQLTFFRRALVPPGERVERDSSWAADQVYMAHLAVTDVNGRRFQALERFARGAAGLAGAQAEPFRVWLEDWSVHEMEPGVTRMTTAQQDLALNLVLTDLKGPILQGNGGYSPKGPQPGNASYYYSLTRLETRGTVQIGSDRYEVSGLSWMDHEWSTSGLAANQVGWDWFSIQMDDNSELMAFQLRQEDGSIDPFSSGTLIAADGSTRHLDRDQFEIQVEDTWRSPNTGATYPARWILSVPTADLVLVIEPLLADQELTVSYAYWEGAVRVEGERDGQPVGGNGYVEMTGYAASMQGQF